MLAITGIEINGLKKGFVVAGKYLEVLSGIDMTIPREGFTVILGKSGCGKTTLLRILAGLIEPDAGTLAFDAGIRCGMVFQEPRLMPWLTVWHNVIFGLEKQAIHPQLIKQLIDTVGLSGFEQAYPRQLSGGMQQRVALARALAYQPTLILMDEPFAALDYFTRELMQKELIRIYQATGKQIVFVTHNIDEALLLGQTIFVLNGGKLSAGIDLTQNPYDRDLLSASMIAHKKNIIEQMR